jgi:hypothetical protein
VGFDGARERRATHVATSAAATFKATSTSRRCRPRTYGAARSAARPPAMPPSAAPEVIQAMYRRAACGSNASLTTDQNDEMTVAPKTAVCRCTRSAVERSETRPTTQISASSADESARMRGSARAGEHRASTREKARSMSADTSAPKVLMSGSPLTPKCVRNKASRLALRITCCAMSRPAATAARRAEVGRGAM